MPDTAVPNTATGNTVVTNTTPVAKPGYLTTEFWVTAIPLVLVVLNTFNVIHIPKEEYQTLALQIGSGVTAALYIFGRSQVKAAAAANQ